MSLYKFSEFLISRVKKFEWDWENAVSQGILHFPETLDEEFDVYEWMDQFVASCGDLF